MFSFFFFCFRCILLPLFKCFFYFLFLLLLGLIAGRCLIPEIFKPRIRLLDPRYFIAQVRIIHKSRPGRTGTLHCNNKLKSERSTKLTYSVPKRIHSLHFYGGVWRDRFEIIDVDKGQFLLDRIAFVAFLLHHFFDRTPRKNRKRRV